MVKNEEGLVAVRHWNSNPVTVVSNGNMYSFTPQFGASIAWVKEDDVASLLSMKAKICCGQTKDRFFLPDQQQVTVWQTGHL